MSSDANVYPVPLSQRKPVPDFARAWGPKIDYPAPSVVTAELAQNISIDSIFINFVPSPSTSTTTFIRELVIPDKCEECRLRAKGCDRARPLCGRCRKIGKTCVPVSDGFSRLRKGKGGKILAPKIWGQAEDPNEVEREDREREKLERQAKAREAISRETPLSIAPPQSPQQNLPPIAFPAPSLIGPGPLPPTRKRKRTISTVQTPSQTLASPMPPPKGHYVDYSISPAYFDLFTTSVQSPDVPSQGDPSNIPIDPQLFEVSPLEIAQTPKRARPSIPAVMRSSTGTTSTNSSTSLSLITGSGSSRQSSFSVASPTTPYGLANLSIHTPTSLISPTREHPLTDQEEGVTTADSPSDDSVTQDHEPSMDPNSDLSPA